ncbi:tetratricopeptide repeat protein [Pedobacter lithocola]|uniref:Tetratricopeptide repeat protein n=1 Tax=Pedobacter lithocola TaxID=1908239 RepID=A0ABV8PEF1_9SPHI
MLLFCSFAGDQSAFGQTNVIDSLTKEIALYIPDDEQKARMLYELSTKYLYSNPKKALSLLDQILTFENKINNTGVVSSSYRLKGMALYILSDFPKALTSIQKAARMDRLNNNMNGLSGDLATIGTVYLALSNYQEALSYYLQAAKIFDNLKGRESDATGVYANIGLIYSELKEYDKALEHMEKSYIIFRRLNNFQGAGASLGNLAVINAKKNDIQKALFYGKKAVLLCDSVGDQVGVARENGNLSEYYMKAGQYDLALKSGIKAIEINKSLGNTKSLSYNMNNVAEIYFRRNEFEKAAYYGLISLETSQKLKILEVQRDASETMSRIYEKRKMPDSSLLYYRQYATLKDSISNDQKTKEIIRMNIQYDFDKKETTYKQHQLLSDEKLKQQQLQIALNIAEIQKGIQLRDLQAIQLQNEKLQTQEKEKKLIISTNKEKLQRGKLKALSQEQQLNKLRMNQFWLYGILFIVIVISVSLYLLNLYRIRQLKYKNTLQRQESEQQSRELTYQHQLSESKLKAIRAQMNPHFIFNVLNSIESYIMENDKKTASRLVQKFASLSRLILENSIKSLVTADKEWKALILYTELQALRYNNTFKYEFIQPEDLQLSSLLLPPMLIQPLIENAIYHGLIPLEKYDKQLYIRMEKAQNRLKITVEDNGIGLSKSSRANRMHGIKEKSIGIESIQERVEMINLQYKTNVAGFSVAENKDRDGTIAIITLPLLFVAEEVTESIQV